MTFSSVFAQTEEVIIDKKRYPILFVDASFGYVNGALKGFFGGGSVNYQKNKNLFTFRSLVSYDFREVDFFLFFPISGTRKSLEEYSLLYGRRFIEDGFSYHFSGGISYNTYKTKAENIVTKNQFFGFPLEIGVSWFKSKKEKFKVLYGLIPVGKQTSFGRSFGLNLYANFTEKTYIGLGLKFGIGWHKKY